MIDDLSLFGADAELIGQIRRRKEEAERFEVHDDCWPTVEVFLACDTQWRMSDGMPVGLDFNGVLAVLRFVGRRPNRDLFDDLKVMERAALAAASELRKNK